MSSASNPPSAMSAPPTGRMLTSAEAAELCRVTPGTIREWRISGHLPGAVRLRGRWLWRESDVLALIAGPAAITT